jgi:murein DD-endopeptidase MepM/ murein hydrolase activator NlpD
MLMRCVAVLVPALLFTGCSTLPFDPSSSSPGSSAFYRVNPSQTWSSLAATVGLDSTHVSDLTLPEIPNLPSDAEMAAMGGEADETPIRNRRGDIRESADDLGSLDGEQVASRAPGLFHGHEGAALAMPLEHYSGISRGFSRGHHGIDFAAHRGTPVHAAAGGRVIRAGRSGSGYGNWVVVAHRNGLQSIYAHLSEVDVEAGDEVDAGDKVGEVGSTGRSTGPHLHFEVRRDNRAVDPQPLLDGNSDEDSLPESA